MITVSRTFARAATAPPSTDDLHEVAGVAYAAAETAAAETLEVDELGSRVEVREGSTEVIVTILGAATTVVAAIGSYDGFWSGVERLADQARRAGLLVLRLVKRAPPLEGSRIVSSRVTTGQLASLQRLHRQVDEGLLTADEGVQRALRLFRDADGEPSETMVRSLESAFRAQPQGLKRLERLTHAAELGMLEERGPRYIDARGRLGAPATAPRRPRSHRKVVIERLPSDSAPTIRSED